MKLPFPVVSLTPVSGGDLNDAFRAQLTDGRVVFVKTSADAAPGSFAAEAAALAWIAAADGAPPVPAVLAVGSDFLALEWVTAEGGARARDDEAFGRGLAALHRAGAPRFGALAPGVFGGLSIGPLVFPTRHGAEGAHAAFGRQSAQTSPGSPGSWTQVYRDERLLPLVRQAVERGSLTLAGASAVESVCERLDDLAGPPEPPARLHGDLWAGNALGNHLIDPAAYGGHREVDLALMRLFGGFAERCFSAYAEAFALSEGWADRVGLWQLFPLLVHAVLFGGGYGARVEAVARRYVSVGVSPPA